MYATSEYKIGHPPSHQLRQKPRQGAELDIVWGVRRFGVCIGMKSQKNGKRLRTARTTTTSLDLNGDMFAFFI